MTKWVYSFGDGAAEGDTSMRNLLGGKGANLAEMCNSELPVPPGFTITTEVCGEYYSNNESYPEGLNEQVNTALSEVEKTIGSIFGSNENPLLVSVRSGARASMPGMMDTILNLGLNDQTVQGLANKSGNERFAYDSYRRFIQMYSDVVLGVDHYHFEELLDLMKQDKNVDADNDLESEDLKELVRQFKAKVLEIRQDPFPEDPQEQLWGAIGAVMASWTNPRANTYRKLHDIPAEWGTAVNIQSMVFGNMGDDCATGVAFTRDPSTGEKIFFGEYLINAQGEDVVAGIRTPQPITLEAKQRGGDDLPAMEEAMPKVYGELVEIYQKLEAHYKDMQDIEFTVQNNKLWMLQTRSGKRSAAAALKIAVDMVEEGLITKAEAIKRIEPESLDQLLHPTLDPDAEKNILTRGLPASPGAASGIVVFTSEEAEFRTTRKEKVVLVRIETSPEDIHGMHASQGIVTSRGGMTSHAAVVARGMGTPCVCGAGELRISYENKTISVAGQIIREGDVITINGSTGEVMLGEVSTIKPELSGDFSTLMAWADDVRSLAIRANAETPADTQTARDFGAEGIGLCRTEHMFFDAERIISVREMILSETVTERRVAINKLLPYQRSDFVEIFRIMDGLPVTIRLLDPPLHEFLPHGEGEMKDVATAIGIEAETVISRTNQLKETNPMLGHRGCRLGITYPEIYEMQVRAILEAAILVAKDGGIKVLPEIMIPLVMVTKELEILKNMVNETAKEVFDEQGASIEYMVGTMIELPRAALMAGEIADHAEFFSFGTNDLTQTAMGLSRDDAANFLGEYEERGIIEKDPFVALDQSGVGELVEIASERGRKTTSNLKLGVCGEHGGHPASIDFFHKVGLNYVSCSPYRVPIARLAAAHAAINNAASKRKKQAA